MKFQGKVAVVSGGASGIGEGICRRFAEEGASVIVADIDGAKAEAQEIASNGGESMSFAVDVCLYDQVLTLVESLNGDLGGSMS
jgi:NAD(P)-dependent dehydrogenase (short-subunit alcohol dehydrogenase family)